MHQQGSGYCPGKSRNCTEGTQSSPSERILSRMSWTARRGRLLYVTQEEGRGTLEQSGRGRGSSPPPSGLQSGYTGTHCLKIGKRLASCLRELSQCYLEQLCPQTRHSQITTDNLGPCSLFLSGTDGPVEHTCGLGVIKDLHVNLEVVKTEIVSTPSPLNLKFES